MALALLLPHIASAQAERKVNINEYIVRGNTVLDARSIEKAVYPFLGPERSLSDIEKARDALQEVYNAQGYQSVYVDLPEQAVGRRNGLALDFRQAREAQGGQKELIGRFELLRLGIPGLVKRDQGLVQRRQAATAGAETFRQRLDGRSRRRVRYEMAGQFRGNTLRR